MERTFYVVKSITGKPASDRIGTVLGKYAALHVAVAVCHRMSDDLRQHWDAKTLVIVESKTPVAEGEEIARAAAVRVFDSDGTRH